MAENNSISGVPRDTLNLYRQVLAPELTESEFERGFAETYKNDRAGTMEYLADETFRKNYEGKLLPGGEPFTRETFDELSGHKAWADEQTGFIAGAGQELASGASRMAGGITRVVGEATGSETIKEKGKEMLAYSDEVKKDPYVTWDEAKSQPVKNFPLFVIQTLIGSIPEMAAALPTGGAALAAGGAAVALGYAGNILETRAKNNKKLDEDASLQDWLYALGGGAGIAALNKIGLEGALSRKALKQGAKALAAKEVTKRVGKGAVSEAATEVPQEVGELFAGRLGTDAPDLAPGQLQDLILQAGSVGAAGGGVISGIASGAEQVAQGQRGTPQEALPLSPQEAATPSEPPLTPLGATPEQDVPQPVPGEQPAPDEVLPEATPDEGADISMLAPGTAYEMIDDAGESKGVVQVTNRDENNITLADQDGREETLSLDDPSLYLFRFAPVDIPGQSAAGSILPAAAPLPGENVSPPGATAPAEELTPPQAGAVQPVSGDMPPIAPPPESTSRGPQAEVAPVPGDTPLEAAPLAGTENATPAGLALPPIATPQEVERAISPLGDPDHARYQEEMSRLSTRVEGNPDDAQAIEDLRKLKGDRKQFLQLDADTRDAIDALVTPDEDGEQDIQADQEAAETVELENARQAILARLENFEGMENYVFGSVQGPVIKRLDKLWDNTQKLPGFQALSPEVAFQIENEIDARITALKTRAEELTEAEKAKRAEPKAPETEPAAEVQAEPKPPEVSTSTPPEPESEPAAEVQPEPEPAKPKKKAAVTMDPAQDDILAAVALLGGMDRDQAEAQWDTKDYRKTRGKGRATIKPVFKKGGRKLDDLAGVLAEAGYLKSQDLGEMEAAIKAALGGEKVKAAGFQDIEAETEQAEQEQAEQDDAEAQTNDAAMKWAMDAETAGVAGDKIIEILNATPTGSLEQETAFKAAQAAVEPEPSTAPESAPKVSTSTPEPEPSTAPESELTEQEEDEIERSFNLLRADIGRLDSSPSEKLAARLEKTWTEMQELEAFKKLEASGDTLTLQAERMVDDALDLAGVGEDRIVYGASIPDPSPELTRELDALALQVLPKGVGVELVQDMLDPSGQPAAGKYSDNLITVAAAGDAAIETFNHETIHALRDANLFTTKEWTTLIREADEGKWLEHFKIPERDAIYADGLYKNGNPTDAAYEEAIADAYRDWVSAGKLPPGPHRSALVRLFARMTEFFRNIGRHLMQNDYPVNPRSVFENIASGEIGSRGEARAYAIFEAGKPIEQRSIPPTLPESMIDEGEQGEQGDLFGSQPTQKKAPTKKRAKQPAKPELQPMSPTLPPIEPGTTGARVGLSPLHMVKSSVNTVSSPEDAAQVSRGIQREAQETFALIVTDKNKKLLGIIRHTIGGIGEAKIFLGQLMGTAHQLPGAANVWATHNHPSGTAKLSDPDHDLNKRLADLYTDSGLKYRGILAVPAGNETSAWANQLGQEVQVSSQPTSDQSYDVPVYIRTFERQPDLESGKQLRHSGAVAEFGRDHFRAGGVPSILFFDGQMRPIGTYAMTPQEMAVLRGGRLGDFQRMLSETNASSLMYIGAQKGMGPGAIQNLANAAHEHGNTPLLEVILFEDPSERYSSYLSLSEERKGDLSPHGTFYSRGKDRDATLQGQLPENLRQDENGKTEFDKGVERNLQGIDTAKSASEFITENIVAIKNRATRTYEHLPHEAEFSELQERLRHLVAAPDAARVRIAQTLANVLDGIDKEGVQLLTKKILLDDFAWTAEQGMAVPYGLTSADDVAFELQRLESQIAARPDIRERVERRQNTLNSLRNEMLRHKVLRPEQAHNTNYAHHQVVAYAKTIGVASAAGKIRSPSWMRREGSTLDINANYVQAEASWMQKAYQDIATKKFLTWLKASSYNKRPEYQKRANDNNDAALLAQFKDEAKSVASTMLVSPDIDFDAMTSPSEIAAALRTAKVDPATTPLATEFGRFRQQIGSSLAQFRSAMKDVDPEDVPKNLRNALQATKDGKVGSAMADRGTSAEAGLWDLIGWVTENPRHVPAAVKPGLGALSSISKRRAWIRKTLGDSFINPRSTSALIKAYAPEGSVMEPWQEDAYDGATKKMTIFNAKTVPEHVFDVAVNTIEADDIKTGAEYLAVLKQMVGGIQDGRMIGAPTYEMIVDSQIASTLNDFSDPALELGIQNLAQKMTTGFKTAALFSPQRFMKYISNDEIGDIDSTFALRGSQTFGFLKNEVLSARKEIVAVLRGEQKPSEIMLEAIEYGVVNSGRTPQEVFQNTDFGLPGSNASLPMRALNAYLRRVTTISSIRENMHRLAAYRYFREQELNPEKSRKETGYGASKSELIDSIADPKMRAAKLARDAYGDYGGVSDLTRTLSRGAMPFVKFMATNTTRYNNFLMNAFKMAGQENAASGPLRAGLVGASLLGRMFVLYGAVNIGWNYLFHGEEEEELGPDVRNRLHAILGRGEDGTIYSIRAQGTLSDYLSWVGMEDIGAILAGKRTFSIGEFIERTVKAPLNKVAGSVTPYIKTPLEIATGKEYWPDIFMPRNLRDPITHALRPFAIENEVNMVRRWTGAPIPSKGIQDRLLRLVAYAAHPDQVALSVSRARAYKFLADNRTSNSHLYSALYMSILYEDTTGVRAAVNALEDAGVKKENIARAMQRRAPLSVLPKALREEFLRGLSPRQREQLERAQRVSGSLSAQAREAVQ